MLQHSSRASDGGVLLRLALALASMSLTIACAEDFDAIELEVKPDGSPGHRGRGNPHRDASASDGGEPTLDDGGSPMLDAGPVSSTDAGSRDAGFDAGPRDAGFDAGPRDAGFDAGPRDAGFDAGPPPSSFDAGFDAGPPPSSIDAGFDAGPPPSNMDAGFDAGPPPSNMDAGFDAGPPPSNMDAGFDAGPPPSNMDAGIADAGSTTDGGSQTDCCGDRDLGPLPADLSGLTWPALPVISQEMAVTTDAELHDALATRANVRIFVGGSHTGDYYVRRSDVELVLAADAFIERLHLWRSQRRLRVRGGTVTMIEMAVPIDYPSGSTTPDPALMASDLTVECVRVSAPDSAFILRGSRVAIIGADVSAERYSLFAGDTGTIPIEDVIVAHSVFRSAGPEATYRVHNAVRSVVAHTTLSNTYKHNYRVHGRSERNYIGDSVLVGSGVMMGREPNDLLDRVFFVRNNLYYDGTTGLFLVDEVNITLLTVTDNVAFSDQTFFVPSVPGWEIARNATYPYQPPPSSVFSCR